MDEQSWLTIFIDYILQGFHTLLMQNVDLNNPEMIAATDALYNSLLVSVAATLIALLVGAMIQAFFNLFGVVFRTAGAKGVRRR